MGKRGGRHQQALALAQEAGPSQPAAPRDVDPGQSPLARMLLLKLAWGGLSAPDAQQIAMAATQSGCEDASVAILAGCGTWGQNPQNTMMDILRQFAKDMVGPPVSVCQIPMVTRHDATVAVEGDFHMLKPHSWLQSLGAHPAVMESVFGISKVRAFWDAADPLDPKFQENEMLNIPRWQDRCIPLLLHGDGGEFSDTDSLMTISSKALTTSGTTAECQLALACLPKSCRAKNGKDNTTFTAVLKELAASFTCCLFGEADGEKLTAS